MYTISYYFVEVIKIRRFIALQVSGNFGSEETITNDPIINERECEVRNCDCLRLFLRPL